MPRKSSVMNRLKAKWEIESNAQLIIIFIVFAVTGSTASKNSSPGSSFFWNLFRNISNSLLAATDYFNLSPLPSFIDIIWLDIWSIQVFLDF